MDSATGVAVADSIEYADDTPVTRQNQAKMAGFDSDCKWRHLACQGRHLACQTAAGDTRSMRPFFGLSALPVFISTYLGQSHSDPHEQH